MSRLAILFSLVLCLALQAEDSVALAINRSEQPDTKTVVGVVERGTVDEANLRILNRQLVDSFAVQNGFGMRRVIAMPTSSLRMLTASPQKMWRVAEVNLIGFDEKKQAVVFETNSLPKVKELKNVQTRSPDEFESKAMKTFFQAAADLEKPEWRETSDEVRVVGALRATSECAECHKAKKDSVLGALSYRLVRANPSGDLNALKTILQRQR